MSKTKIEWADAVWNPITGCTPISPGCQNCYAKRMAQRLRGRCGYPKEDPFRVTMHLERFIEPLRWKKPRKVFVCSMGDLFHEDVKDDWILSAFVAMGLTYEHTGKMKEVSPGHYTGIYKPKHTFLILTKRPERMKEIIDRLYSKDSDKEWESKAHHFAAHLAFEIGSPLPGNAIFDFAKWVEDGMPGLWIGVTAENQEQADKRIPILLQIPAAVRFVSVEPMLGAVDLSKWFDNTIICDHCGQRFDPSDLSQVFAHMTIPHQPIKQAEYSGSKRINGLHWVICGGESGPGARPMHPDWVRNLRDQCQSANVPFFFKQWGEWCHSKQMQGEYDRPMPVHKFSQKTVERFLDDDPDTVIKCGKKKAGRLLDGREWNEFPEVTR